MKSAMKLLITLAATSLIAVPARADWQYTKWRMSPGEVIAASGGALRAGTGAKSAQDDTTKDVEGVYIAGDVTFGASLWFAKGKLAGVSLTLRDGQKCVAIGRDLRAKYGEPVEESGAAIQRTMWRDTPNGNRVTFINTDLNYCELQYAPMSTSTASGL